jgi:hypothetical protein
MPDSAALASYATAAGTLVLAVATFASVRSANAAARTAERSFDVGLRPLLFPSRLDDPDQKVRWGDEHWARLEGGKATVESNHGVNYLALSLRNVGSGMAVIHAWRADRWVPRIDLQGSNGVDAPRAPDPPPGLDQFRALPRDLSVPPSDMGFGQGAIRDDNDPMRSAVGAAIDAGHELIVDVLYGDHEGGQRTISRFLLSSGGPEHTSWVASVLRHWSLDRPDPRA